MQHLDVTKQGFCKILWRKLYLWGSLLLVLFSVSISTPLKSVSEFSCAAFSMSDIIMEGWGRCSGGGHLFETGRLLTFSAFRMGANSRLGAYSNKYGKRQCTKCLGHWTCNLKALSSRPTLIASRELGSPFVSVFEVDSTHGKSSSPGPTLYMWHPCFNSRVDFNDYLICFVLICGPPCKLQLTNY